MTQHHCEIAIVGAGLSGLAAAMALGGRLVRRPLKVMLIDRQDPFAAQDSGFDGRTSALTHSSQTMLKMLGVWSPLASHCQEMKEMIITDAQGSHEKRPKLLHFGKNDSGVHASIVENHYIFKALTNEIQQSDQIKFLQASIESYQFKSGGVTLILGDGQRVIANLIVAADGGHSRARLAANIETISHSYGQSAITTIIAHSLPHQGCAWEHFTAQGPFAILPLPGNRSSLVWTESSTKVQDFMGLNDEKFLVEIERLVGKDLGTLSLDGPRHLYPLRFLIAKHSIAPRLALIGEAAHIIHPLAGLGFNLSLRDSAALSEAIMDGVALGFDPAHHANLIRYQNWRHLDTSLTAYSLDAMNTLFANDKPSARFVRQAGLSLINQLPAVRSIIARCADHGIGHLPKLLRGEML